MILQEVYYTDEPRFKVKTVTDGRLWNVSDFYTDKVKYEIRTVTDDRIWYVYDFHTDKIRFYMRFLKMVNSTITSSRN